MKAFGVLAMSLIVSVPAMAFNPQPDPPGKQQYMACQNNMRTTTTNGQTASNHIIVQSGIQPNNTMQGQHTASGTPQNRQLTMNGMQGNMHCNTAVAPAPH